MIDTDREAVKTLAIAVGVREAARRSGLPQATVQAWSARYKWFKTPELPPTMTHPNGATIATTSPSVALANVLADHSRKTKLALAKGFTSAAEHYETLPGEKALREVGNARQVAQGAALVHAWEQATPQGTLSVEVVTGETAIRVRHSDAPEAP